MALAVVRGREERSRARLAAQEAAPKIPGVLQDIVRRATTGGPQKRLRRTIFMIFTAYFDESGTHAGAELTAMAGFLGDPRQWRKFERRTGKLFKRFHVDVFHAIDVRRSDKDFAGWSVDRKIELFDEFQHIINETLESGVAAFLRHEDYRYYCALNWPKKARRDSKYAILFRACLAQVIDALDHIPLARELHLRVVLEDGHKNAGDVVRVTIGQEA